MDRSGHPSLTFRHWAGVSTYTSAFALAGTCVCGKQSLGPLLCDHTMLHQLMTSQRWLPLSRSYGYILPSSLTRVLPRTLGFSPRIPVSVYGTGGAHLTRSFSRQCGVNDFEDISVFSASRLSLGCADLPTHQPTRLHRNYQSPARLPSCVTPSLKQFTPVLEYQPVVHLLRSLPRIRSRLTLGRRSLPRNPYAFGGKDSHLPFRYSYQHSHFPQVHHALQHSFCPVGTLPYPTYLSM